MLLIDMQNCSLTSTSTEAVKYLNFALVRMLNDQGEVEAWLEKAIAEDPRFFIAIAHLARLLSTRGRQTESIALLDRIKDPQKNRTAFEQSHGDCILELTQQNFATAIKKMEVHLDKFPFDLAIATLLPQQVFFFGGLDKKENAVRIAEKFLPPFQSNRAYLSRYAFHLQEIGRTSEALKIAEGCLIEDPSNNYATHIKLHIAMEAEKFKETLAILDNALPLTSPQSYLYGHFQWHKAIALIETGATSEALDCYADFKSSHQGGHAHLDLADDVGFLWRLKLRGSHEKPQWMDATESLVKRLEKNLTPFVSAHKALYFALVNDWNRLTALRRKISDKAGASNNPSFSTVCDLIDGLEQFSTNNYTLANKFFGFATPARVISIGGSNIERDLIEKIRTRSLNLA